MEGKGANEERSKGIGTDLASLLYKT
jgi:hypothetical protein